MSSGIARSAMRRKMSFITPGRSGRPASVTRAASRTRASPVTSGPTSPDCVRPMTVPGSSVRLLRTTTGTPYLPANSMLRECITPAPRLASSSISS